MTPIAPGSVVLYALQGKTYNALVLYAHSGQADHLGKNGEPLIHIAFVAPERESAIERAKYGYIPQIFREFDVVHASHEFSDEYKKAHNLVTPAQISAARGQGEWSAVLVACVDLVEPGTFGTALPDLAPYATHIVPMPISDADPDVDPTSAPPEPTPAPKE